MRFFSTNPEYEPLGRIGRVPVYVTTILTALFVVGVVVVTMLATAGGPVNALVFSPELFYGRGWVWQLFTCTFVNYPNFFFLFGVFCFYRITIDVEQFLGRRTFLKLYAIILATPAIVLGLWYTAGAAATYGGMYDVLIGMFIALATLYPTLDFFGWVPLKYVAFACIAIAALGYFPGHDWIGLSVMLAECAVAFGFIRYIKRGGSVDLGDLARKLNFLRRRRKFRVVPSTGSAVRPVTGEANMQSVDAILDKIAQTGFASLTPEERDQLERARDKISRKRN